MGEQLAQEAHPGQAQAPAHQRLVLEHCDRSFTLKPSVESHMSEAVPPLPPSCLRAMPSTMERDDVRAYAMLGHLEARAHAATLRETHARAYCALRSRGAAIAGIYQFWPLSRGSMRRLFQGACERGESVEGAVYRWQQEAAHSLVAPVPTPHELCERKERLTQLHEALERLSQAERALLEQLYGLPLSNADERRHSAASCVHKSTLSRRHAKVLARLRRLIRFPTLAHHREEPHGT